MRSRWLVPLATCVFVAPAVGAEPVKLADLVERLGSDDFATREDASRKLAAGGEKELAAVRAALQHRDLEVRRRAADLAETLHIKLESARAVVSPKVRLLYKEVPLKDALADFSRRAGVELTLAEGPADKLKDRKLSLDTGEVTAWEAVEKFIAAAGLSEQLAPAQEPVQTKAYYSGRRRVAFVDDYSRSNFTPRRPVVLGEAKAPPMPTFRTGSLRLQALPGATVRDGKVQVNLDVRTDARLGWESVVSLRVEKAVDDRGQKLKQPLAWIPVVASPADYMEVMIVNDRWGGWPTDGGQRHLPVILDAGEQTSTKLKELRGVVAAMVRLPAETVAEVVDLTASAGKTFEGRDGSSLRVNKAERATGGQLELEVRVAEPQAASPMAGWNGRIARFGGGMMKASLNEADSPIRVLDGKGNPVKWVTGTYTADNDGAKVFQLCYQPTEDQIPARLTYTARRTTLIEVPFTLTDVPLK